MKYIVFRTEFSNGLIREFPVLFPSDLTHSDVSLALIANCIELKNAKPVGAGEISCTDIHPTCHGQSSTLGVKSRGKLDNVAFTMRDYNHGMVDK